jgi:hypothetical protein
MKLTLFGLIGLFLSTQQSYAQSFSRKYDEAANKINWPTQFDPNQSDFYVHNEIEIKASPEVVWALLVEALEWKNWYDGIQDIRFENSSQTKLEPGAKVFWNSMGQSLNNSVMDCTPYSSLAWQFEEEKIQGYHAWVIIPTESGCKVVTDESQNGKLARLQKKFIPKKLMKQHDNWLRLLKEQAEGIDTRLGYNPSQRLSEKERSVITSVLNQSLKKFDETTAGLGAAQLEYKLPEGGWSIAECIEHVTLAELHFPEIVNDALQRPADPEGRNKIKLGDHEIRPKMTSRNWKARSPEIFKPSGKYPATQTAIEAFRAQRLATIAYIDTTTDDLRHRYWRHPLTGTIDLYQTLLLMSAHLDRHVEQMERIKLGEGFPKVDEVTGLRDK